MNLRSSHRIVALAACAVAATAVAPAAAYAHTGVGMVHGLLHGLQHPLTGLDHLCAMLAVGLWASQRGGRAVWLVPLSFVAVMTLGGVLGMAGVAIPFVEQGVLLSVLVLGVLVAAAIRLPLPASVLIVGVFALLHGHAHGTEIPSAASGATYALGFLIATAGLHLLGIGVGLLGQRLHSGQLARFAGAAITACGVYLCITP